MSDNSQSIIIQTGSDPRQRAEFSAIREEINKINHPARPEVNWNQIETLALTLFRCHGVDLQTAVYYSLARTQRHGLAGFTEGCELLAGMIVGQWERLWPQQELARTEILDWFNTRVGNQVRQHHFVSGDLRLVYRAERALQLMCDKLQQVELKRVPRIENLLYLMQNSAKRLEANDEEGRVAQSSASDTPTMVYLSIPGTEPAQSTTQPAATELIPGGVTVHSSSPAKTISSALRGFVCGVSFCLLMAAAGYLVVIRPAQQQLTLLAERPEGAVELWLSQPDIATYSEHLRQLENLSPLSALQTADNSLALARERWPNHAVQLAASQRWERVRQTRLGAERAENSYFQLQQQLQALSKKLIEQEQARGSLTISWLKTAVYKMQSELNRETPLEELLRQFAVAAEQDQPVPPVLIKQIDDRLNTLLSRYHQLTQQAEPAR